MKILVVAASENEINPFRNYIGTRLSVDILITGIGSVATAYSLTKQLGKKEYDLALNFGLAGSFSKNLEIGSIVNVTQEYFADLGAEDGENFLTLAEMGLSGRNEINNESEIENEVIRLIPKVCGITVNKAHGNEISIERTFNRFHPNTESMEGGAFLYCCIQEKIPCTQIRAMSNFVERRNKNNWNIPLAIENLNKKAIEILEAF